MATLRERILELHQEQKRLREVMDKRIQAAMQEYSDETAVRVHVEVHLEGSSDVYQIVTQ